MLKGNKSNNSDNSNTNAMNTIPSIDYADLILYAPHSKDYPQITNDKGQIIKGTALVSFMGYRHSLIEWIDEGGIDRQVPKLALIFAVKLQNGAFKNIPFKTNYACSPGSNLELALKALGVTPEYETIVTDPDDELFGTITKLNREKLEVDLETFKGLAYLVEIENKQSKNGRYYNDINLDTLKARIGKDGTQMRIAPTDKCDVSNIKITFD